MLFMMLYKDVLASFLLLIAGFTSFRSLGLKISSHCLLQICSPDTNPCASPPLAGSKQSVSNQDVTAINDLLNLKPPSRVDDDFFCACKDVYEYMRFIQCNCSIESIDFPDNGTCRVTHIDFSNMELRGSLLASIGNLTFLRTLDLSANMLSGMIPMSLINLTQISVVALENNYLEGPVPPFNGKNEALRGLFLSHNLLNGSIPKELGELPSLKHLYLRFNALTGRIPDEIWNIKSLLELKLQDNQFDGDLPEQLGKLENIEEIVLMNNNFSGLLPKNLGHLRNLRKLKIQGSNFNGTIPDAIGQLPNLRELAISDVSGDEKGNLFPDVGNLTKLLQLTLRNCALAGPIPPEVWQLPNLEYLDLSFNKLSGEIPSGLGQPFKAVFIHQFDAGGAWTRTKYLRRNELNGTLPRWANLSTTLHVDLSDNHFTNASFLNSTMSNDTNLFSCCSSASDHMNWLDVDYRCANDMPTYDELYINCGGNAETINGRNYEADLNPNGRSSFILSGNSTWGYSSMGGSMYSTNYMYIVSDTCNVSMVDAPLYIGARVAPISLKYYGFCLRNDNYMVRLHFSEIGWDATRQKNVKGRRVFNVEIQGKKELQDFNIEEAAGGMYKSITKDFNTCVTDNRLEIHFYWSGKGSMFIPTHYGPLISAISVSAVPKKHHKLSPTSIGAIVGSSLVFVASILALFWKLGWLGGIELYPGGFYKFQDIKDATNNFENQIGEGGTVYKGKARNEIEIAVKVLSAKSKQGALQILQEIGLIYTLEHPNIAKPMGCCTKDRVVLLVYKYMKIISLHYALFGLDEVRARLNWQTRYQICLGIAKGLTFLHEESKLDIIHSNIKSTNILLDEDFNVKISDFRYSELHDRQVHKQETPNTPRAKDTGHMAPEYMIGRPLTPKSDVYSFGLVILEIISGQPHIIAKPKKDDIYLLNTAYKYYEEGAIEALIDADLRGHKDYKQNEVVSILHLAMQCVSPSFDLRPAMSEVVQILEGKKKIKRKQITALPMFEPKVTPSTTSTGSGSSSQEGASRENINF